MVLKSVSSIKKIPILASVHLRKRTSKSLKVLESSAAIFGILSYIISDKTEDEIFRFNHRDVYKVL